MVVEGDNESLWIGIHSELLGFTESLLNLLLRPPNGTSSRPGLTLSPDVAVIEQHIQQYRDRLEFWQRRARPGASLAARAIPQHTFDHSIAPRIMGAREAALELGVSATYVRRLLVAGRLAGRRMGSGWVVDAGTVAAFQRELQSKGRRRKPGIGEPQHHSNPRNSTGLESGRRWTAAVDSAAHSPGTHGGLVGGDAKLL